MNTQLLHEKALLNRVGDTLSTENPFQNPFSDPLSKKWDTIKRPQSGPVNYRQKRALESHESKNDSSVYNQSDQQTNLRASQRGTSGRLQVTQKQQYGAPLDFDEFFKTCDPPIINPVFSKTTLQSLEKPKPLFEIYHARDRNVMMFQRQKELEMQQKNKFLSGANPDEEDNTFLTAVNVAAKADFQEAKAQKRADYFQIRKENRTQLTQQLFKADIECADVKERYERELLINKQREIELKELKKQQTQLYQQYQMLHQSLYHKQSTLQKYQVLQPLLNELQVHFPQLSSEEAINKLSQLQNYNVQMISDQHNNFERIQELESKQNAQKAEFLKIQVQTQQRSDSEAEEMSRQINDLQEFNKGLETEVKKAQEIQKRYLQACQDIIAYWINMSKMYGPELSEMLKPSVNNPIEVLRALDTVFSVIYPESPKAQDNFKRIAASCAGVWAKLLVGSPDSEELRSDFECILSRACQYYKNSQYEIKRLEQQNMDLQVQFQQLNQQIIKKVQDTDALVQEIRAQFNENVIGCEVAVGFRKHHISKH